MLKIREEQMAVFAAYERSQFEKNIAARLREDYPDEAGEADEAELLSFVAAQIAKAGDYGITRSTDVEIYVDRAAYYGANWDAELDWAKDILTNPDLDGPARIEDIRRFEATSLEEFE